MSATTLKLHEPVPESHRDVRVQLLYPNGNRAGEPMHFVAPGPRQSILKLIIMTSMYLTQSTNAVQASSAGDHPFVVESWDAKKRIITVRMKK